MHPVERLRFRQAPLAAAAVWFAAGIGTARLQAAHDVVTPTPFVLAALLLLFLLTLLAFWRAARVAWLPVAAIWLTLGMAALDWYPAPGSPETLTPYADNLSRTVRGRIVRIRVPPAAAAPLADTDQVQPWEAAEDTSEVTGRPPVLSMELAVDEVEDVTPDVSRMTAATGGARVSLYAAAPARGAPASNEPPAGNDQPAMHDPPIALQCGDRIELPLRLKLPNRYRDPGAFQYADQLAAQGIVARAGTALGRVQRLGTSPPTAGCRLGAAQAWASARLLGFAASRENQRLPPWLRLGTTDAHMLAAMLFGDRSGLTHSLRTGFERTGSFHLFVVSGMHIALLAGGVYWLLRRLRCPVWLATVGTLAAATAYAALTGFGQPAQRALGMTAVFLLARLLSREHAPLPLNALGAATLTMLVWSPASLFDASFQMTVLAIVAIAGIAIPLGGRTVLRYLPVTRQVFARRGGAPLSPRAAQLRLMLELWGETLAAILGVWSRRLPAFVVRVLLTTAELALIAVVAELVMVLPMAMYFHRAAVYALPANLFVVPLIAVLAPSAVVTFVASLVSPWLALVPGSITALMLHAITTGIRHVSRLQGADVRVPGPSAPVALGAVLVLALCCWLVRRGRWPALAAAVLVPLVAVAVLWPEPPLLHAGVLEVTALDVGQGDSLLAANPQGGTMLIDAGGPIGGFGTGEVVSNFDVGEEVVSPYLWSRRLRHVDVVVLTHAHTDHMGGMPAVLENFRPRELWVGVDPHSALYAALLAEAAKLGILVRHVHAGDHLQWGSVEVAVLAPATGYGNPNAPRNDDSVVLRMQSGQSSVLLEGDAERPSEDSMAAVGFAPVTLLKVGHHGSRTSTNPGFLALAQPRYGIISDGRGNPFGHPRAEVITRLAAAGTHLYRTDEMGLTTFLLAPDGHVRALTGAAESPAASQASNEAER